MKPDSHSRSCLPPARARLTGCRGAQCDDRLSVARRGWRRLNLQVAGDSGLGDRHLMKNFTVFYSKELGAQEFLTAVTCLGSGASPAWLASVPSLPKSNSRGKAQHLGRSVSAGKPCGGHTALPPVTAVKASLGFQRETCRPLSSHCSPPESRQVSSRMSPQQQLQGRDLGGFCYNPRKNLREDQTDVLPL